MIYVLYSKQVYYSQQFEDIVENDPSEKLEETVAELKQTQKQMMKMLREQQERAKEQQEINQMLRDFILKSVATHD